MIRLRHWVYEALRVSAYTTTEHMVGHRKVALACLQAVAGSDAKAAFAGDVLIEALRHAAEGRPLEASRVAEQAMGMAQ